MNNKFILFYLFHIVVFNNGRPINPILLGKGLSFGLCCYVILMLFLFGCCTNMKVGTYSYKIKETKISSSQ